MKIIANIFIEYEYPSGYDVFTIHHIAQMFLNEGADSVKRVHVHYVLPNNDPEEAWARVPIKEDE